MEVRGSPKVTQSPVKGREPYRKEDKSLGSEVKAVQNPERDSCDLTQNRDRSTGSEGQAFQNLERLRKAESQSVSHSDKGKRSEVQNSVGLERGKSENHMSISIDKGRVVGGGQASMSSKTSTR